MPEKEIPKTYNPAEWEQKLYALWEKSGFFNPDNLPGERRETFSTIMPPPNANGRLHVGHSLDMTLKDIKIRFERMRGKKTLFLPGADHAGFETQMVFEKKLAEAGKTRFGMSNEELYRQIYDFTIENKQFMESDLRRLGISCDWSRNTFTLDSEIIKKVQATFIKMHQDGLIYRGKRIVNWNPKFQTSLSEIETVFVEQIDPFYYLQYGPFVIGTVRPETKFGDKYVVMHPTDERYKEYVHGQKIKLEWINGPVTATIIKDTAIDREFGTGVMTITPWHDPIDFEIAVRHNLEKEQVIDFDGKLLPIAGEFAGLPAEEARLKIVEKLKQKKLLVKVEENYRHNIRICERTKVPIEPQIKDQWFVKMKPLAEQVIQAVERENRIQFLPEYQKKILLHWMYNTIDWNISRQIVWGISIPAWFKDGKAQVGYESPGEGWIKDSDTFDTWFSSGQWPLLTLGYPENKDFQTYYPTDLMEAGTDLVFKWIPRMILFGLYLAQKIPFKTVYFHGMVNDAENKKMSKSKGNVISPVEMGDKYGIDALRLALVLGNTAGSSTALSERKIEGQKHFANKLWNMARYVLILSENKTLDPLSKESISSDADHWILFHLQKTVSEVTNHLQAYNFSLALETLREFIWNKFADQYIEVHKIEKNDAVLRHIFGEILHLAHPFMPYVTEAIFQILSEAPQKILMVEKWPEEKVYSVDEKKANRFQLVLGIIQAVRTIRANYKIDPAKHIQASVRAGANERVLVCDNGDIFKRFARISDITILESSDSPPERSLMVQSGLLQVFIHLAGVIDFDTERTRLEREKQEKEQYIAALEEKLSNPRFLSNVDQEILFQTKENLENARAELQNIQSALSIFSA